MDTEKLSDIFVHGAKAAHLIGRVHGMLHGMVDRSTTEDVRKELIHLLDFVSKEAEKIFYGDKG